MPCTNIKFNRRQVDFDKTKHLAESSSKQRKAERERIINEERFETRLKKKNLNPAKESNLFFSHQGKGEVREEAGRVGGDAEKSANVSLPISHFIIKNVR